MAYALREHAAAADCRWCKEPATATYLYAGQPGEYFGFCDYHTRHGIAATSKGADEYSSLSAKEYVIYDPLRGVVVTMDEE